MLFLVCDCMISDLVLGMIDYDGLGLLDDFAADLIGLLMSLVCSSILV